MIYFFCLGTLILIIQYNGQMKFGKQTTRNPEEPRILLIL